MISIFLWLAALHSLPNWSLGLLFLIRWFAVELSCQILFCFYCSMTHPHQECIFPLSLPASNTKNVYRRRPRGVLVTNRFTPSVQCRLSITPQLTEYFSWSEDVLWRIRLSFCTRVSSQLGHLYAASIAQFQVSLEQMDAHWLAGSCCQLFLSGVLLTCSTRACIWTRLLTIHVPTA